MKYLAFIISFLIISFGASSVSGSSTPVTMTLVSFELEDSGEGKPNKIVGKFLLRNRAKKNLCIMRDIVVNQLSPYMQISETKTRSNSRAELPLPPKTREIMRIAPSESITIARVIGYTNNRNTRKSMRVYTFGAWCGINQQVKIETKRFRLSIAGT
jgi:hypothetical protein